MKEINRAEKKVFIENEGSESKEKKENKEWSKGQKKEDILE